jgi:hypothetical protein
MKIRKCIGKVVNHAYRILSCKNVSQLFRVSIPITAEGIVNIISGISLTQEYSGDLHNFTADN